MLVVIAAFILIFVLTLVAISFGTKFYESRRRRHVTGMLETVAGPIELTAAKLLKDLEPAQPSGIRRLLSSFDFTQKSQELLQQAGLDWKPMRLLTTSAMAMVPGLIVGTMIPDVFGRWVNIVAAMALFGAMPYLWVKKKRSKRLGEMEEQLPEALDFMARSMRAGHAFTISLEMLGGELPDPLGQEFRTLFNEQNLGAALDVALRNLCQRVPLLDVRFFASSVMLQRQTGGNLAEILTHLAYLIRERFRLKGQVKAVSSHGRMTALVLTLMPFVTMLGLMFVSPEYLQGMAKDPDGRLMIIGALLAQVLARVFIKKIVNIKV